MDSKNYILKPEYCIHAHVCDAAGVILCDLKMKELDDDDDGSDMIECHAGLDCMHCDNFNIR